MPKRERQQPIDPRVIRALGHPLRGLILDILGERTSSPNRLKDMVDESVSHVSYHVRVLEKCGAIELVDQAQVRGATEHFYRATPRAFLGNPIWRRVPKNLLATIAGSGLQSFFNRAVKALEAGHLDRRDAVTTWLPLAVDDQGKGELTALCRETTDELLAIAQRSSRRLARSKAEATPYVAAVMAFEAAAAKRD